MSVPAQPKNSKSKSFQVFQSNKFNLNDQFLPRIKKQKLVTKNPFLIKKQKPLPLIYDRPGKELNGFLLMKVSKAMHPEEVTHVDLNGLNLTSVNQEHLQLFKNLRELDVGMNQLCFQDLLCFQALKVLHFQGNIMDELDLEPDSTPFPFLETLDISYNRVAADHLVRLNCLKSLRELNLSANDLSSLPVGLTTLTNIESLNLASNLINSNSGASQNWEILAALDNLRHCDLSRNQLRGIHTEKLKAGDFLKLESLDMSYNIVENQYNLICSRNFQNLKSLTVTGNPFAVQGQHKGLEMEVMARTGAQVINEVIERKYLKKRKVEGKADIQFGNMLKLTDQYIKKGDKTYFFGCNLANFKEQELLDQQEEEEEQPEEQEDNAEKFFLTEDVTSKMNKTGRSKKKQTSTKELEQQQIEQEKKAIQNELRHFERQINKDYDNFKRMTAEIMGQQKDYDDAIDIQSSYKILNQIIRKPNLVELNDHRPRNYEKNTLSMTMGERTHSKGEPATTQHLSRTLGRTQNDEDNVQAILSQLNKKISQELH